MNIISNAYEYLIGKFASGAGKKAGEFYTPPEVSLLLATLLEPKACNRICDPACGTGSLLIKCANAVGSNNYAIYGQENNGSTWALAMMNMFLQNIDSPTIQWGDTSQSPSLLENDVLWRYNVVVANPPSRWINGVRRMLRMTASSVSDVGYRHRVRAIMLLSRT